MLNLDSELGTKETPKNVNYKNVNWTLIFYRIVCSLHTKIIFVNLILRTF